MASVTQCDICKNVVKHEQSKYVKTYDVNKNDELGNLLSQTELCPDCYKKVAKILNIKLKEEN